MEAKSESKIQTAVEREHNACWRDIVKLTNMKAPIALLIQQKVTATSRLLFFNYNQGVCWSYTNIVFHCC
jgi:hypothetical protein